MRNNPVLLLALILFNFSASFGQTASDIESTYGKPINAYSVSQFIWMTPEYAANGQVCRMRLYPKRISDHTSYVIGQLSFDEFRHVVDRIVPPDERGTKRESFDGGGRWTTGGGTMWAIFTYEKVSITYSAGFRVDPNAWKDSKPYVFSEEVLSLPEKQPQDRVKAEDEFLPYRTSKVEIVTIDWLNRECAAK